MRKLLAFTVLLILSVTMMMAQTKTITGRVVSAEDGEPVVGASVVVPGTTIGVITDVDGNFSLKVPEKTTIIHVSFVGMKMKEAEVKAKMEIVLEPESEVLDDVIVVAYGTQRKTSLTGAVQSIKAENIEMRPTSSAASALEGSVSGVQVNSTYGAPGSDPTIRIRGIGTVNGSSSPLYILDGVPYGGNISDLNPADIESMSVLKDAASAALYGNRASNGVVLITTKRGKNGRLNVNLDIKTGSYSRGTKEYELTNAKQWMELQYQNLKNHRMNSNGDDEAAASAYAAANLINDIVGLNIYNKADDQLFDANGKLVSDAKILDGYKGDLDWEDYGINTGFRQEYNLSANGATDKSDYLLSFGYLDENGYIKDSGFERYSGRVSLNINPKKWFKAGLNINATHQNYNNTNGGSSSSYTNVFMYARQIAPVYPVHLHDVNTGEYLLDLNGKKQYDPGSYTDAEGNTIVTRNQYQDRHVYWENELNYDKTVRNTMNGIAYASFILPYGFTAHIKGNLNTRNSTNYTYNSAVIGDGKGSSGRAKNVIYRYKTYSFQQQLEWTREFGDHSVDALIGHENYHTDYNYFYGYKTNEIVAGWGNFTNFTSMTSMDGYDYACNTESYLGRVRYGYLERYNVEASFRRDGSSRFNKDARWGNFWSVGGNWVISSEEFLKSVDYVDFLKLRADYGEVGNDAGAGYYGYQSLCALEQNANVGALYLSQFSNPELKWETSQSWGVAVEGRLFDRVNFTVEYFDKRNKDLLFDVYLPLSAGATSNSSAESTISKNLGTISNHGWELSADGDVFKNKDWRINVGFNATFLKNKVVKLPEQNKDGIIDGTKKIVEGKDRYSFYLYTCEGTDSFNGKALYKFDGEKYFFTQNDVTYGDKTGTEIEGSALKNVVVINDVPYAYTTTHAKKEFHGSAIPTVYGSFNANVNWRFLSLTTLFTYQLGGKVLDTVYSGLLGAGSSPSNMHVDALSAWTLADKTEEHAVTSQLPVVNYDLTSSNYATSSRWLTDASYLVLKNVSLSAQLPKAWAHKCDLSSVALNLSCENLFTLTKRQGMNPQQSFNGTQYNYLVTPRVFTVGLNVKF